jgi:hypothetical protein
MSHPNNNGHHTTHHASHSAAARTAAHSVMSPDDARAKLVEELELGNFDEVTQNELIDTALEALMNEVMIAVFSWIPESEYAKIEALADEERDTDVQAIITKHVAPEKIATIIDGIFSEGVKRYKELLAQK